MYNKTVLENNLIAIANYGDHYKLTNTLNTLHPNDFQAISENTYDTILDDLIYNRAQKGMHSVCSALHVFVTVTKPFLPISTKEKAIKALNDLYEANYQ